MPKAKVYKNKNQKNKSITRGLNWPKHRERLKLICAIVVSISILGAAYKSILEEEKIHREEEIAREVKLLGLGLSRLLEINNLDKASETINSAIEENEELISIEVYRENSEGRNMIAKASNKVESAENEGVKKVKSVIRDRDDEVDQIEAEIRAKAELGNVIKELFLATTAYTTAFIMLLLIRNTRRKSNERLVRQNKESQESQKRLRDTATKSIRMAFDANSDGWWEWRKEQNYALVSKRLCETLGIELEEESAINGVKKCNEDWWETYIKRDELIDDFLGMNSRGKKSIEVKYQGNNRGEKYAKLSRTELNGLTDKNRYIIFSIEDITSKILRNKIIEKKAFSDNLTGLANRASFEIELEKISSVRWRKYNSYALFIIDIDNFKHLNDTNGHVIGDLYLREISNRLKECLRPTDFIGRIGGDEFVVIAKFKYGEKKEIETRSIAVGEKIRKEIAKPFVTRGIELKYQCSIGICTDSMQTEETMSILDYADIALYKAKGEGRDRTKFFEEEMKKEVIKTETIKEQLESAMRNSRIEVEIQPICDISLSRSKQKKQRIHGYEALLRCKEIPTSIEEIIGIAEKTGQVRDITREVVRKIGLEVSSRRLNLEEKQTISINVSAIELLDMNFPERFLGQLNSAGLRNNQIFIEVTETAFINNIEIAKNNMNKLREHGIRFAIDDFGTGYASISMLRHIAVERIKLDQSYIENIENDVEQALIKTVIWMARALNVELVAEGIEKEDQLKALTALGCKLGQGFLFNSQSGMETHLHSKDSELR